MGLFKSDSELDLNLTNVIILIILSLVFIQAIGLILNNWADVTTFSIKLGPAFILISVGMTASLSIAVVKKLLTDTIVTQKDVFAMLVVATVTLVLLFFLRDFLPEIFNQSMVSLQSMVGYGG